MLKKNSPLLKYWLDLLGGAEAQLCADKVNICRHPPLDNYYRVFVFKKDDIRLVSLPDLLFSEYSSVFQKKKDFDVQTLLSILGNKAERVVGPAWIGTINEAAYVKQHGSETRLLNESDSNILKSFLSSCSPEEVRNSGFSGKYAHLVGTFDETEKLVSLSNLTILKEVIGHVGVLTSAAFRGRGFARKSISGITEVGIEKGLCIQYQTLESNPGSIKAAESVGFHKFAETISVKIVGE